MPAWFDYSFVKVFGRLHQLLHVKDMLPPLAKVAARISRRGEIAARLGTRRMNSKANWFFGPGVTSSWDIHTWISRCLAEFWTRHGLCLRSAYSAGRRTGSWEGSWSLLVIATALEGNTSTQSGICLQVASRQSPYEGIPKKKACL